MSHWKLIKSDDPSMEDDFYQGENGWHIQRSGRREFVPVHENSDGTFTFYQEFSTMKLAKYFVEHTTAD